MRFVHDIVVFAVLMPVALTSVSARAQSTAPPADYDANFNYDCDRTCLSSYADQTLAAFVAHDPSRLPLARDVKYTENGRRCASATASGALPQRSGTTKSTRTIRKPVR